jgi:hypothetical protein
VVRTTPAQIVLRLSRAGTTVVRVHWSPQLRSPGASVSPHGPWAAVTAPRPGIYILSAPY